MSHALQWSVCAVKEFTDVVLLPPLRQATPLLNFVVIQAIRQFIEVDLIVIK